MKALVYLAVAKKALAQRPKPEIVAPIDAIIKITGTTICGIDLHILKGDLPSCKPAGVPGHEGVGVDGTLDAHDTFERAAETKALKVIIEG